MRFKRVKNDKIHVLIYVSSVVVIDVIHNSLGRQVIVCPDSLISISTWYKIYYALKNQRLGDFIHRIIYIHPNKIKTKDATGLIHEQ